MSETLPDTLPAGAASARNALYAVGSSEAGIVPHRGWVLAWNAIGAALDMGARTVALIGPEGSGRRTLAREIAQSLGPDAISVLPDADRVAPDTLDRALAEATRPVLLTGGFGLEDTIASLWPETAIIRLPAIPPEEAGAFIATLCRQAGHPGPLVPAAATRDLHAASRGRPGALCSLTRIAALVGAVLRAQQVEPAHVEAAQRLFEQRPALPDGAEGLAPFLLPEPAPAPAPPPAFAEPEPEPEDGAEPEGSEPAGAIFPDRPRRAEEPAAGVPYMPRPRSGRRWGLGALAAAALIVAGGTALVLMPDPVPPPRPLPQGAQQAAPTPPAPAPQAALPPSPAQPLAAAGGSGLGLPVLAPVRVLIRHAPDRPAAQEAAAALARRLQASGFETAPPASGPPFPDRLTVGFYYFEDRAAAASVAQAADRPAAEQGLLVAGRGERLPEPGTVELYVGDPGQP